MTIKQLPWIVLNALFLAATCCADEFDDTASLFKNAGESATFFDHSYAYAVFPTIGKGGLGVGAAHGSGRVFVHDNYVGDVTMNQVSIGMQAGGQAFSQIVFFQDQRAFEEFTTGGFEFDATVQAVAITAAATASTSSAGTSAGASGGKRDATTVGAYHKGMAVFTIAKGGSCIKRRSAARSSSTSPAPMRDSRNMNVAAAT